MVAFLEDNRAFVSDLLLCFEKWRLTFIHREDFGINSPTPHPLGHFYLTFSPHPTPQRRCLLHFGESLAAFEDFRISRSVILLPVGNRIFCFTNNRGSFLKTIKMTVKGAKMCVIFNSKRSPKFDGLFAGLQP